MNLINNKQFLYCFLIIIMVHGDTNFYLDRSGYISLTFHSFIFIIKKKLDN